SALELKQNKRRLVPSNGQALFSWSRFNLLTPSRLTSDVGGGNAFELIAHWVCLVLTRPLADGNSLQLSAFGPKTQSRQWNRNFFRRPISFQCGWGIRANMRHR